MDVMTKFIEAYETMKDLSLEWYLATVAMLVEEKCKAEKADAVQMFRNLYESAIQVNDDLGKY